MAENNYDIFISYRRRDAGVHTLLMSLKKVYDASTADLMIFFYHHLKIILI